MRKWVLGSEIRAKAGGKEQRARDRVRPVAPRKAKADAVAKARAVAPDLAARIGSTPATKFRGDPDIFGRLVEDHDRHRALLAMLEETDFDRHAIAEHQEIDDLLADLAARDMASPGWIRRFAALREEYLHHIREEEQEQFVAAEEVLSLADRRFMRTVFNRRKQEEKAAAEVEKKIRLKA